MVQPRVSDAALAQTWAVYEEQDENQSKTARILGLSRNAVQERLRRYRDAVASGNLPGLPVSVAKPFEAECLPSEMPTAGELIARRKEQFERKRAAKEARKLIRIDVRMGGPIGIVHFGDPHVDDDGTDLGLIERHVNTINRTEGLFGANVGDLQNAWVGRLARLWGEQSTSAAEAWVLTEWLFQAVQWLYLIRGNHDCWTGSGDPIDWMKRQQPGVIEPHGARMGLHFPNGRQVRVNARHDFTGHSMWNTAHGPAKAAQMGWRDHILTCGHTHVSGYQVLKDPASGLVSHAIRVGSYKTYDRYAEEKGLPDQNIFPACVTVIDPQYPDTDPRLITTLFDVEEGAEFLTWKRKRAAA